MKVKDQRMIFVRGHYTSGVVTDVLLVLKQPHIRTNLSSKQTKAVKSYYKNHTRVHPIIE